MPRGVANAYWFQGFNSTSYGIILGMPMLLYLKSLGASGIVLGIMVALLPLTSVLQIPSASFAEKIGYKILLVRGWAFRSIFILGIAIIALMPDKLMPQYRIALVLLMLTCFAVVRNISMCGYWPLITGIIPEELRGKFLSRDTMCMYIAFTVTMLFSSFWIGVFSSKYAFGSIFLYSYLTALAAVVFLRRIPDIQDTENRSNTTQSHPPWMKMLRYPPFAKYIAFTVAFSASIAAMQVVWVPFMRDSYHASGSLILGISAFSNLIAAIVSRMTGTTADRFGSRPLLGCASGLIIIWQGLLMAMASGAIPHRTPILFGIILFGAAGFAVTGVASTRLIMGIVPVMGRSHFFAISSVANSLTLGVMPIVWGLILDSIGGTAADGVSVGSVWTWDRYSITYAASLACMLIAQYFRRRLDEPKAISTEKFMHILFIQSPTRLVLRVMHLLRRFPHQL
ncbi:MAG: MFS transporter [Lentisphaerae bacterium]|nr:MFS transporter [Lentisphaerota bacterium]